MVDRGDLRRAGDGAAREHRPQELGEPDARPEPALDGRDHVRDAGQLALGHQVGPADRPGLADAREVVALEVDDHDVLGGVLLRLAQLAADVRRPGALDRFRPDPVATAGEEELRRARDDRPAVAGERLGMERAQARETRRQAGGVAREGRAEVLDEVHLVDVAAGDRRLHGLDRLRVGVVLPRPPPFADREPAGRPACARPRGERAPRRAAACTARAGRARARAGASSRSGSRGRRRRRGPRLRLRRSPPRAGSPRAPRGGRRRSRPPARRER